MDTALAPGFARTTYNGARGVHHMITPLNISPSAAAGVDPTVTLKDTTTLSAENAMRDFWGVVKAQMGNDQTMGLCEIYKVDALTGEGTFLWGFDLDLVGGRTIAGVAMSMATMSFKLVNGRIYKLTVMDTPAPANQKDYAPYFVGGEYEAISDYIISGESPVYGRGNAYPFASIALTTKTSDALRAREGLA